MFRPLLTIIRFLIRKKCMLEECLYKACSCIPMLRFIIKGLELNMVYSLRIEPSEVGSESVGGGLRF